MSCLCRPASVGLALTAPSRGVESPVRCPHPRVDCGWMDVEPPRKTNWLRLMRTKLISVNLLRDWKRGCFRCEAGGVFVEKKRMNGEIFFGFFSNVSLIFSFLFIFHFCFLCPRLCYVTKEIFQMGDDDDCFYYHSWRNNVVVAFGTLSSFLT